MRRPLRRSGFFGIVALAVALGAIGCAASYQYVSLENMVAQPKDDDCEFNVLEAPPDAAYDSLGIFAPTDIESDDLDGDVATFKESATKAVCAAGGDALVAEKDAAGRYVRGTIVKFK